MAEPGAHPAAGEIGAAGTVLWRRAGGMLEVALIHRPRHDDWTFPKGKGLPGEHVLLTAAREVAEETGIRPVLGRRLSTSRYPNAGGIKRVDWWAAAPALEPLPSPAGDGPGALAVPPGETAFRPNDEVDELAWLPLAAARGKLSYPRDVALLDEFAAGPADTSPVIVIRHADAQGKAAWQAAGHTGDLARPLTALGEAQSRELAQILCCFGPVRLASSAAERCLATVRPYAAAAGAVVGAEPAFTVGAGSVEAARRRIATLVGESGPVAVCGHRENLPALLAAACERLGAAVPAGPPLPKGGFWVLQAAAGTLVSTERHDLSA